MGMKIRFYMLALFGSLLNGVDLTLSGGILVLSSFMNVFFPELYPNQSLHYFGTFCDYQSPKLLAIAFIPCVIGWVFGFLAVTVQPKCGPRTMMIGASLLVLLGGVISILFVNFASFLTGRIILGIGMAMLRQVVPIYITEVPPRGMWDTLDIMYDIMSTCGTILGSVFISIPIIQSNTLEWRFSAFPIIILSIFLCGSSLLLPESPKYLIIRGNINEIAQRTLATFLEPHDAQLEYHRLAQEVVSFRGVNQFKLIITKFNTPYLRIKLISICFQSFLGSSTLLSFLPGFLVGVGIKTNSTFLSSLAIGVTSMIAMTVSVVLIKVLRCERRMVLLTGCIFTIFGQISLGSLVIHYVKPDHLLDLEVAVVSVIMMCIYVSASSMLPGPLGWLAANYPAMTRVPATFLSRNTTRTADFFFSQIFIVTMCYIRGWIFILFAVFSMCMLFFIYYFIPETSGLTIEEMTDVWRGHRYWSQFVPPPANNVELLELT